MLMALCGLWARADDDHYPLQVRDEWTYATTLVAPGAQVIEGLWHDKVEATVEKDGKIYFRWRRTASDGRNKEEFTLLLRKDEKAVYTINDTQESVETVSSMLPVKVGATLQWVEGTSNVTGTVIGVEPITTSTKTYAECFHIRTNSSDGSYTKDQWLAVGIGLVRSECVMGTGLKYSENLIEFKPGK
jgi:hypothetical protein